MTQFSTRMPQFTNFTELRLSSSCVASDTTLSLASVTGMPALVSPLDYVPVVIRGASVDREVVHVTAVDTVNKTITVLRGREGTTAQDWSTSAYIYCDLTAESARDMLVNTWRRPVDASGQAVIPTRVDNTTFTLVGDHTSMFVADCALRIFMGGAILDAAPYVVSASYSTGTNLTTVTIEDASIGATPSLDLIECSMRPSESPRNTAIVDAGGGSLQPLDATLSALAALSTAADRLPYATGVDQFSTCVFTALARTLLAGETTTEMRTALGLGDAAVGNIGVSVQAYAANLAALAGLAGAANKGFYFTGSGAMALMDVSSFARNLLDDADAASARSTLGLVIGTDVLAPNSNIVLKNAVNVYTKQQYAAQNNRGSLSGAIAVDANDNQDMLCTLTAAATFGAPSNSAVGMYMVWTLYAASAYALTFNAAYLRSKNNALPTALTANKRMFLSWRCYDGTNWILVGKDEEN